MICLEQVVYRLLNPPQLPRRSCFLALSGFRVLNMLCPSLDLSLNQFWFLKQSHNLVPNHFIEVVLTNGAILTHSVTEFPVSIGAKAPIVEDLPL